MKNVVLRDKDKQILTLIVDSYLRIGNPISSGFIAQKIQISVSPATVRNIMVKLEKQEFLFQPHTSAGRIPTDKGLRFYVNNLLSEALLPDYIIDFPSENQSLVKGDFKSLLNEVSKILSEYSDNLGFVLFPGISKIHFNHIRFIKIAENKVISILSTTFNFVLTETVQTNTSFTQVELDSASQYINQNFRGKNLLYVRNYLLRELPKYKINYENIIDKLISLLKAYISQEDQQGQIFLQGTPKLLEKHDLFNMERLQALFQNFEEKAKLARLLSDFISFEKVKVLIGSELDVLDTPDCSLILSHYEDHNQVLGSLGIIGPKRIPYKKIIPIVDYVAKRLSQMITHNP